MTRLAMTRRGLSAIELLVALAVMGLAAASGTATLAPLADRRNAPREAAVATTRAAAVRRTLVGWLEGAHGALSPFAGGSIASFQLHDRTSHGRARDELLFSTSAETPLGTGETLVRLYVDEDDRTPERGLVADLLAWPGGPSARLELDSTVAELDVRCLTDLLSPRGWTPSYMSSQVVPRGVELRLRSAPRDDLHPLLRLPIRVAIEAGR
jgi:prepilin-type N-terminal cleavage/methylation domain-containing protein